MECHKSNLGVERCSPGVKIVCDTTTHNTFPRSDPPSSPQERNTRYGMSEFHRKDRIVTWQSPIEKKTQKKGAGEVDESRKQEVSRKKHVWFLF